MERQEVRRVLLELAQRAKHLARWPQALKPDDIKAMADYLDMVRYFTKVIREPAQQTPSQVVPEYLRCVECQALGIASAPPLWHIGSRWLCLRHIPPDVTFPIGLWGDDWIESGRSPTGAGGQRRAAAGAAAGAEIARPESWAEAPKEKENGPTGI